jgi:hypothetical protein
MFFAGWLKTPKTARPKTYGFWEDVFPDLDDDSRWNSFRRHFRITRRTFNRIVRKISVHPRYAWDGNPLHLQEDLEIQVALCIWRFANGRNACRLLEIQMGTSLGGVFMYTERFLEAMIDEFAVVIGWPTDLQGTKDAFRDLSPVQGHLPDVIGAIDGCHIRLNASSFYDFTGYWNRKGFPSINVVAVVDAHGRFTFVHVGEPGSTHDSRAFKRSELYSWMQNPLHRLYKFAGSYIIGDSAYPLLPWMLTPYDTRDTHAKARYNKTQSSIRMIVERAFGKLQFRFIILQDLFIRDHKRASQIIYVCMLLHNMCIDDDDQVPDEDAIVPEGMRVENYRTAPNFEQRNLAKGGQVRDAVAAQLLDQY